MGPLVLLAAYGCLTLMSFLPTIMVAVVRARHMWNDEQTLGNVRGWGSRVYDMSNHHPTLVILLEMVPQTIVQLAFFSVFPDFVLLFCFMFYSLYLMNIVLSLKDHEYPY